LDFDGSIEGVPHDLLDPFINDQAPAEAHRTYREHESAVGMVIVDHFSVVLSRGKQFHVGGGVLIAEIDFPSARAAALQSRGPLEVTADAPLHVNGLFQALWVAQKLDFKSSSETVINGRMGLGPPQP